MSFGVMSCVPFVCWPRTGARRGGRALASTLRAQAVTSVSLPDETRHRGEHAVRHPDSRSVADFVEDDGRLDRHVEWPLGEHRVPYRVSVLADEPERENEAFVPNHLAERALQVELPNRLVTYRSVSVKGPHLLRR